MHPLLNIAITAARKAGAIIMRATDRLEAVQISAKPNNDIVTDIDHLAEREIIQIIHKAYPSHEILAEESGLQKSESADNYRWIIDPIDGTLNFSRGFPHFAVSIAVQYKDKIEHGVIYDPVRQELFTATRGAGAKLNQYRMRVSQCDNLRKALLSASLPHYHPNRSQEVAQQYFALVEQAQGVRKSGSAALDLAYIAAGRLDAFYEFDLKIWDIAAGVLLVTEAGGLIAEPNGDDKYLQTGNVLAATPKLFSPLLQITKDF